METEKRTEEQKRTEALALLKSILEIPSVNGKDREQETAVYLAEYLKRKGMETRVQLIDEHHGNVIGVLRGKTEETILFNGHLDTVPYGDINEWNTNPAVCAEQDGRLYARGASDMKSGLAVMAFVLGELAAVSYTGADASRRKQLFLREPVMRNVAVWAQRKS